MAHSVLYDATCLWLSNQAHVVNIISVIMNNVMISIIICIINNVMISIISTIRYLWCMIVELQKKNTPFCNRLWIIINCFQQHFWAFNTIMYCFNNYTTFFSNCAKCFKNDQEQSTMENHSRFEQNIQQLEKAIQHMTKTIKQLILFFCSIMQNNSTIFKIVEHQQN